MNKYIYILTRITKKSHENITWINIYTLTRSTKRIIRRSTKRMLIFFVTNLMPDKLTIKIKSLETKSIIIGGAKKSYYSI